MVEYLQAVGAAAAERQRIAGIGGRLQAESAADWGSTWTSAADASPATDSDVSSDVASDSQMDPDPDSESASPSDRKAVRQQHEFRDTADYLRARLRITRADARRRVRLGLAVTGQPTLTGEVCPPRYEVLATAFAAGDLDADAALRITDGVDRARTNAGPEAVLAMEECLTAQAVESDGDLLRIVTRRWECVLDPDGSEPTDETLRAHQGVFMRGRRRGLQRLEIAVDDEQFEYLLTAMNTAANPRLRTPHSDSAPLVEGNSGTGGSGSAGSDPESFSPERSAPENATAASSASTSSAESGRDHSASASSAPEASGLPETRTRPQLLLDGLVGACQVALATDTLPATGGHRPQVMVTIDYQTLVGQLQLRTGGALPAGRERRQRPSTDHAGAHGSSGRTPPEPATARRYGDISTPSLEDGRITGRSTEPAAQLLWGTAEAATDSSDNKVLRRTPIAPIAPIAPGSPGSPGGGYSVFGGPISAGVVRKMACDADLIPIVLGGQGEILDVGRARRLFGVAQRRALVARDRGCAFPSCTIPAVWTEAHHITPWADGGPTDVSNGCLLCSFHHRLIEQGNWTIEVKDDIPWFIPPPYLDPRRVPRRNQHRGLAS